MTRRLFSSALTAALLIGSMPAYAQQEQNTNGDEPISPFVADVIERANVAIGLAEQLPKTENNCEAALPKAIQNEIDSVKNSVDIEQTITLRAQELKELSICQRYDLFLLEKELITIEENMTAAVKDNACKLATLDALSRVYTFVSDAYTNVWRGGLDPEVTDFRLRQNQGTVGSDLFIEGNPQAPVCPFHSDYAPPSIATIKDKGLRSVGCDETMLTNILAHTIPDELRLEAEATRNNLHETGQVARSAAESIRSFLNSFTATIARFRGRSVTDLPAPSSSSYAPHDAIVGCKESHVFIDEKLAPSLVIPWTREELPADLLLRSVYDNFRIEEDAQVLMRAFFDTSFLDALRIPLPEAMRERLLSANQSFITIMLDQMAATGIRAWEADNALTRATFIESNSDGLTQVANITKPLRLAVQSLGYVASYPTPNAEQCKEKKGSGQRECCENACGVNEEGCIRACQSRLPILPSFTRDVALFLRRSCINGPCNVMLDSVLKRIINPACYPFGSGCYRKQNYSADRCLRASDSDAPFACYDDQ